ncbi:hypothetical protein D3C81_1863160 [compost metagenome]
MGGLLKLSTDLGDLLQLLHSFLMALQSLLDHLTCLMLALCQFLQFGGVLLFLLKELLVILAGLLRLGYQLLDDLFTLVDLAENV